MSVSCHEEKQVRVVVLLKLKIEYDVPLTDTPSVDILSESNPSESAASSLVSPLALSIIVIHNYNPTQAIRLVLFYRKFH